MGEFDPTSATLTQDVSESIDKFLRDLKKQHIKFSNEIACESIKLLERIVTNSEWETAKNLMDIIRSVGRKLKESQSAHTIVMNMVKRVLKIIRDEYMMSVLGKDDEYDQQESLQKILMAEKQMDFSQKQDSLKRSISANLRELIEEFDRSPLDIAEQSQEHIHFDEVIMTSGSSRTVERFLKKAAPKRKCQVFIAESSPVLDGHNLAKCLAESKIQTTIFQDAAIFAIMSRVNKVIVGAHSVMANGGVKAPCGTHALALAAKYHAVPFIVLAPMYKLTPQYATSSDQEGFNHMLAPEDIISFEDDQFLKGVEVINPAYDYVPPDLITLIISNIGGNSPSYVYRLLSELYHRDDYDL